MALHICCINLPLLHFLNYTILVNITSYLNLILLNTALTGRSCQVALPAVSPICFFSQPLRRELQSVSIWGPALLMSDTHGCTLPPFALRSTHLRTTQSACITPRLLGQILACAMFAKCRHAIADCIIVYKAILTSIPGHNMSGTRMPIFLRPSDISAARQNAPTDIGSICALKIITPLICAPARVLGESCGYRTIRNAVRVESYAPTPTSSFLAPLMVHTSRSRIALGYRSSLWLRVRVPSTRIGVMMIGRCFAL